MNQIIFVTRNITDKFFKVLKDRERFKFYWQTYITNRFNLIEPDIYIIFYPKIGKTFWQEFGAVAVVRFRDPLVLQF